MTKITIPDEQFDIEFTLDTVKPLTEEQEKVIHDEMVKLYNEWKLDNECEQALKAIKKGGWESDEKYPYYSNPPFLDGRPWYIRLRDWFYNLFA